MERQPFYLWCRNGIWYYRQPHEKTFHTTQVRGTTAASKRRAERWVLEHVPLGRRSGQTFREYAAPFFLWDECPRVRRLRLEGKMIGRYNTERNRQRLVRHVFPDPFAELPIVRIRRADLLDLRDRLGRHVPPNSLNKIIGAVKTVLAEAAYRQDILSNPGSGIGELRYERQTRGVLDLAELRRLFAERPGPWPSPAAYAMFNTAARTGMRSGEVRALQWDAVDFDTGLLRVTRAWKSERELGPPKSGKVRVLPVAAGVLDPLAELRDDALRIAADDWMFGSDTGAPPARRSFARIFTRTLAVSGIDAATRNITPHSLRHSLNSHLLAAGVDAARVRAYLGWSDRGAVLTPVQAGYTHWSEDALRAVAAAVEELFG